MAEFIILCHDFNVSLCDAKMMYRRAKEYCFATKLPAFYNGNMHAFVYDKAHSMLMGKLGVYNG